MKTRGLLAGAAALALVTAASGANAVTIDISTGLAASGAVQSAGDALDANWTVVGATNPESGANAYTVFPNDADWYGGWTANDGSSDWIAANPNDASGNGLMTFTRTFTVGSTAGASLSGAWTIDDNGYVALNGNVLSSLGSGAWGAMQTFSANSSDFVTGVNRLQIVMGSTDHYLEAARLQGTATFQAPAAGGVPEPAAWALMILGFGSAGAMLRRQKASVASA